MPHFPQLISGACSQYPILKVVRKRTIVNHLANRSEIKLNDLPYSGIEWRLRVSGLTTQEWASIESLFQACEGRLRTFTFLDPAGNLLARSEEFASSPWTRGAMLQLTPEKDDPFGATNATRLVNAAQTAQRLLQELKAPGSFHYCFSVWARGEQAAAVRLLRVSGSREESETVGLTQDWRRFFCSGNLRAEEDSIRFGVEIGPGSSIDLFGAHVEPQLGASPYRKTTARGGVYTTARFDTDSLTLVTEGPDQHGADLRIIARLED